MSDADHEVIDSPEALFRHLYEEHGVQEARDLDPETAPLQFWVRRHADLERAERAARHQPDPPEAPPPPEEPREPEHRPAARQPRPEAQPPRPEAQPPRPASRQPWPEAPDRGGGAAREGRRLARFGDPLVEAMARALAGRGHDEAVVRSAIQSFGAGGDGPSGAAAVRAAFVEPMLQSAAERLLGAPRSAGPAQASGPSPAPKRPQPPRREEPARPEAVWAGIWADLADSGRRPSQGAGSGGDDGDDIMAVANAVQARRRVRRLRR
jgi:hypothetical protein